MLRFGPPNIEKLKNKQDVQGLIKALSYEKDDTIRISAAGALGQINDLSAIEHLKNLLYDKDEKICRAAAEALANIGICHMEALETLLESKFSNYAVEKLIWLIECEWTGYNSSSENKQKAAKLLGDLGDLKAIEPLINAVHDRDRYVRENALRSLGKYNDERAISALILALTKHHEYVGGSITASHALIEMKNPKTVNFLLDQIKNKDWQFSARMMAIHTLGEIGDTHATVGLEKTYTDPTRTIELGHKL